MRRSPARDFVVGLFVLAGLGAVAYLSLSVGGFSLQGPGDLTLYASFDEIGGLKPRAPVVISGVKVGQVTSIALDQDYRARVRMDVDATLEYPLDTSASIMTSGLLGDRYLLLQLGGDFRTLENGDTISFTEPALLLERLLGKFITNIGLDEDN